MRRNSAVCSFSSFASAEMPRRAAKKAPPSPRILPHSTPKNPRNSPKLSLSMPKAAEKPPISANIELTSPICVSISGYIRTQSASINAITIVHMSKVIRPCLNSCLIITIVFFSSLSIIMQKDLFQIRFGNGNIRKVKPCQNIQQILQIAAIKKTYGIPVRLHILHAGQFKRKFRSP